MQKWFLVVWLLCVGGVQAATIESWVPQGWKVIQKAQGDLNRDGLPDVALIIENTDAKNVVANERLGPSELNLNPRHLLIGFQNAQGQYDLKLEQTQFIPSPNDEESSCLQDPLEDSAPMSIKKGALRIQLNYWYSCGTWYKTQYDFVFRYDGTAFALIGFDTMSLHRGSGEIEKQSVNVLTGKKITLVGQRIDRNDASEVKTRTQGFKFKQAWTLEQLDADTTVE